MSGCLDWWQDLTLVVVLVLQSANQKLTLKTSVGRMNAEQEIVDWPDSQSESHENHGINSKDKLHISRYLLHRSIPFV